ncbi:MAG TPA: hypothetical protein VH500_12390 [Nitrososphaeraceae archaeon]
MPSESTVESRASSIALGILVAAATTSIWGIMQFAKAKGTPD